MTFKTLVTAAGQAKLADAISAAQPLHLTQMAVGDGGGSAVTPSESMTALVNEVHRAGINRIYRDPANNALVIAELVIPAMTGGFTVREAGLFADDGVLVAIASLPDFTKPHASSGSVNDLVVRIIINLAAQDSVQLIVDGSVVTATQEWSNGEFLKKSENLADLSNKSAAIQNLGIVVALMQFMYPVGETLITSRSGNPSSWLGFGTWNRVAEGRVLAGVDSAAPAKDAAGKTFGANGVTLSAENLPAHTHGIAAQSLITDSKGAHTHSIDPPNTTTSGVADHAHIIDPPSTATSSDGWHTHTIDEGSQNPTHDGKLTSGDDTTNTVHTTQTTSGSGVHTHTVDIAAFWSANSGAHTHTVDIPAFNSSQAEAHFHAVNIPAHNTGSTGGGTVVDITPASYAVNIWKRTA